jgi:hypothetical protein
MMRKSWGAQTASDQITDPEIAAGRSEINLLKSLGSSGDRCWDYLEAIGYRLERIPAAEGRHL